MWVQLPTLSRLAFQMDVNGCDGVACAANEREVSVRECVSETMSSVFELRGACSRPAWPTLRPARDSCSSAI